MPPMPAYSPVHAQGRVSQACHACGRLSLQGGAQAIKARGLDAFYNLEEDMLSGKADTAAMLRLIQVPEPACCRYAVCCPKQELIVAL